MAKILFADDDPAVTREVSKWLTVADRHVVDTVANGTEAIERLNIYPYDLLILDWKMPECTGLEVCRTVRSFNAKIPILMLTSNASIADKEAGFGCGADDYLTKPFELKELSLRIRALLRRPAGMEPDMITIGDVQVDVKSQRVYKGGQTVDLSSREYCLLEILVRGHGRFMTADEIANKAWSSDSDVSSLTVKTVVCRLRSKLDDADGNSIITNVHGRGYRIRTNEEKL